MLLLLVELRLEITSRVNPKHGPFHPRRPDTYVEKMVRGMLPYKKPKGNAAKKLLRVYISVPDKYQRRFEVNRCECVP